MDWSDVWSFMGVSTPVLHFRSVLCFCSRSLHLPWALVWIVEQPSGLTRWILFTWNKTWRCAPTAKRHLGHVTSLQPVCNKSPQCLQEDQIHTSFYSTKLLLHHLLVQTCLCQKLCSCSLGSLSSIRTILPASFDSFISDRHITVEGHESRKMNKFSQLYSSTDILKIWFPSLGNQWHKKEITKSCCLQYTAVAGTGMIGFWDVLRLHIPQYSWCEYM